MEILECVLSIVSGLVVCIPLVIKLVEYVQKTVQEKNWSTLIALIVRLMEEAEHKFETGASRKEWVVDMVQASATTINYDVDVEVVSELIDSLCAMSKIVNAPEA